VIGDFTDAQRGLVAEEAKDFDLGGTEDRSCIRHYCHLFLVVVNGDYRCSQILLEDYMRSQ